VIPSTNSPRRDLAYRGMPVVETGVNEAGFFVLFCLTRSSYITQVDLQLEASCLSLPSAGIPGVHHHTWLWNVSFYSQVDGGAVQSLMVTIERGTVCVLD
jgi:hypothetical protein